MRILALDAATESCSVALWIDGASIERIAISSKASMQQLLQMVTEVLNEAAVSLTAIDGLAASIGPGAFTGVRVSVAVAQGLAFGAGLPVVPISTLEALALQVVGDEAHALACLDARMNEVYWGCFAAHPGLGVVELSPSRVDAPSAVAVLGVAHDDRRYIGIGRGLDAYPLLRQLDGVSSDDRLARELPRGRDFAQLGALRFAGGARDPEQLQPLYLRNKVAFTEAERLANKSVP